MLNLAILQFALPVLCAVWLAIGRPATPIDLWFRLVASWLLLGGISVAGIWLAVPFVIVVPLALFMLLGSLVAVRRFRSRSARKPMAGGWPGRALALGLGALGLWAGAPAIAGWRVPEGAVDLAFPFRDGRYLVANGGSTARINSHLMTLGPRFGRVTGQSHAVDLIRVDSAGFRTRNRRWFYLPTDPAQYLTFGTAVHAPCAGSVEDVASDRPDMPVPERDRQHLEGNFVRIRCGEFIVLLGHFRRGQIFVKSGSRVTIGQPLGAAGNSGNSDEPHLHVHVQTPGTREAPLSGQPLPVTFDGRFLVRNRIVQADRIVR